ncbi:hypothetical protein KDA14_03695, partial [Candidatus Saccharibacteria bacterium]|nr:hypothetical protein [Candidatus Saccharibacteria bacterium]
VGDAKSQILPLANEKAAEDVCDMLRELTDARLIDIITSLYGLGTGVVESREEIASRHGLSAERVRQLEREAIQIMQSAIPEQEQAS